MAASDEFKEQIKQGKMVEALTMALGEAIELEITTWVSTESATNTTPHRPQPGYCMRTRMNLVDGDIENEVGTEFIGNGPYRELREFHLAQVQEGRQIIHQNLESLHQIFLTLADTMARLRQQSTSRPALNPSSRDYES